MEPLIALLLVLAVAGAFFWFVGAICCGIVRMFVGLFRFVFGLGGRDANVARMQSTSTDVQVEMGPLHSNHLFAATAYHGKGMPLGHRPRRCANRHCGQNNPAEACYCGRCGAVLPRIRRGPADWVRL